MNCSNCKSVGNNFGECKPEVMCEKRHFLCGNCFSPTNNTCKLCGGGLFYLSNLSTQFDHNNDSWAYKMLPDWPESNQKPTSLSSDNLDRETSVSSKAGSINCIFSRAKFYDELSQYNSNEMNELDLEDNQAQDDINANSLKKSIIESNYHGRQNSPQSTHSKYKNVLAGRDTRQNLLEQTINELRENIKKEISNIFIPDPRSVIKSDAHEYIKQYKTIGVSTESEPNLLPETKSCNASKERLIDVLDLNQNKSIPNDREYIVMNFDTKYIPNPWKADKITEKKSASGVDQRLQQVFGTMLESSAEPTPTTIDDSHFYKMLREKFSHLPLKKVEQIISSIFSTEVENTKLEKNCPSGQENNEAPAKDSLIIPNSSRAFYSPPSAHIAAAPNPQFQQIKTTANCPTQIIDAATLTISRNPVVCPISSCRQAHFVSDFSRHIAVDHTKVPMQRIFPHQCKNFFLDPKLIHFDSSRCQILLLVNDKIKNLGHDKFKDFIPVLVMTTKVSSLELCCNNAEYQKKVTKNMCGGSYLMIWLTGIIPPEVPIFFSLTVWANSGNMPTCHIVHSGQLYSVRNVQNAATILGSGQMLLLSELQVDFLTNKGRNMLELQIEIH